MTTGRFSTIKCLCFATMALLVFSNRCPAKPVNDGAKNLKVSPEDSPESIDTTHYSSRVSSDPLDGKYIIHQAQDLPPQIEVAYDNSKRPERLILALQIITGSTATYWLQTAVISQSSNDKNAKLYFGLAAINGLLFTWTLSF